jgi:RNA polymerase sigma-70 factor, ECF subfamily
MPSLSDKPADQIRHGRPRRHSYPKDEVLVALAVAQAKEGDRSALQFLYIRYAKDVHRYVNSIVRDHHEAEDITQGVFLRLTRALKSYTAYEVPFSAWLRRVARNAALENLRSTRITPVHEVPTANENTEALRSERVQDLKEALERLPYEQREVLVLRHLAGLSPGEIARMLHKTESAIHGLHHRARGTLKTALQELEATPVIKS